MTDFAAWMQACQARMERVLADCLPAATLAPQRLHEAMRYAVLDGGKRVRPLLALAAGEVTGAAAERVQHAAAAVELIHVYSLVHDDLPAMDNDALRRGRPTCHIEFGEAMAILAGDALQALAFEVLTGDVDSGIDAGTRLDMLGVLAHACGSQGMAGGQAFDLSAVGQQLGLDELERMHVHKTGALIRASVRLGALAAGCRDARTLAALERYAHCVGLAFQIRDDILDVEGDPAQLGKTLGKDAAQSKPTYPAIIGMSASATHLAELTGQALQSIAPLGESASALRDLARFIAERES